MKDLFILPFALGAAFLFICIAVYWLRWMGQFSRDQRKQIARSLLSFKTINALGEVVRECLFHGRLWLHNTRLGFMHTCFAAGWFFLIVIGHVQVAYDSGSMLHAPWYVIFYRWFQPFSPNTITSQILDSIMNLLLLFMLIGVAMAVAKRFYVRMFGLKRNTRPAFIDLIALWALWCIFPLRFLAESFVVAAHGEGGGPLTMYAGQVFALFLPTQHLLTITYGLYSLSLGVFFVMLPFTRYMHIFTEIPLIFLRHWGIQLGCKNEGMGQFQIHACSSCGVCVSACQLTALKRNNSQPAYFHRYLRRGTMPAHHLHNCLQCGRCKSVCPVGINTTQLRMNHWRESLQNIQLNHSYLPVAKAMSKTTSPPQSINNAENKPHTVAYFQGCMGHLTPSISRAMHQIFVAAEQSFVPVDANRSICCGRPLQRTGQQQQAEQLTASCIEHIRATGADLLVTACPICYQQFAQNTNLQMPVMHHTQYLHHLLQTKRIAVQQSNKTLCYHDPCELSRSNALYEHPREVLQQLATLQTSVFERDNALCCGASLANTDISSTQRSLITKQVIADLINPQTDILITSCNLCKKTLRAQSPVEVMDIAELVSECLIEK